MLRVHGEAYSASDKIRPMFGLRPKLPVTEEERLWVDEGFRRLGRMLGSSRLQNAKVILPTDEFFPDPWDGTESALKALFGRVCGYMGVNPSQVELQIDPDPVIIPASDELAEASSDYGEGAISGQVELSIVPDPAIIPDTNELIEAMPICSPRGWRNMAVSRYIAGKGEERPIIAINRSLLSDTLMLVASLAHELGLVILLDGGRMRRDAGDIEPLADLLTVYLGLGVFTANASRNFRKYQPDGRRGWSMSRLGYLPETVFGFALACFAKERGEVQPAWAEELSTNLSAWFRQSAAWLGKASPQLENAGIYRRR
jgi:hypothetical protein